jgi:hypothetical protein
MIDLLNHPVEANYIANFNLGNVRQDQIQGIISSVKLPTRKLD